MTNPALEVIDIAALAEVAHRHGVPVIVDVSTDLDQWQVPFEH